LRLLQASSILLAGNPLAQQKDRSLRNSIPGVLHVARPNGNAAPVVLDSPHSGTQYPADFTCVAPMNVIRKAEDSFVDELFEAAPECGASLQRALFPRAYIDPNRSLQDIDAALLAGPWPVPLCPSEKTRFGHGLVWRICPPDYPIYDRKLEVVEMQERIDTYWRPYHQALRQTLDETYRRFGSVWHINCHSMPTAPLPYAYGGASGWGDFVLGDRDGSTCSPDFTEFVAETLRSYGYDVRINDPYKGVELIRAHSNPEQGRHSLQIEINRSIYMDETRLERTAGFAVLQKDLTRLVSAVCEYARDRIP
jgi:N-formylglutamate deformylase